MRLLVELKPFFLIPPFFFILSTIFSSSLGQNVDGNLPVPLDAGNLPVPVNGNIPTAVKDGNVPIPGTDGNMPMPGKDGNMPMPGKDGNMPMPGMAGNLPMPMPMPGMDGNLPGIKVPFDDKFSGMVGSVRDKMEKAKSGNGTYIVLAEKQTRRRDPLDHLHYYTGGWNITNKHYYASVAFSSFPFLATALAWFVLLGVLILCACCCCKHNNMSYAYPPLAYILILIFLVLFTTTAIVGCGIMYDGEARFLETVYEAAKYIVNQAKKVSDGLTNVYLYLYSAKSVSLDQQFLPPEIITQIDTVTSQLNASKDLPYNTSASILDSLPKVLNPVNLALILVTATMLLVAFIGFLLSLFGLQTLVYLFVVIGWIIASLAFVLCGAFLAFHNLMADTCIAVDEWVQNPMAGSAIKSLLPCVDSEFGKNVTDASKLVTNGIDTLLNHHVSLIANANNLPPEAKPLYYNQSGPLVPIICDPYMVEQTKQCGEGAVALGNAIQEWNKYVCQVSGAGICSTTGRLTPDLYKQMSAAVNVSYALYSYGPFLASLVDCSMIRDTLKDMHQHHCPGLRKQSQRVYIGLLIATVSVIFCLFFWVFYGRERRHRKYNKTTSKVETPPSKE
ncbi:hypothetical protein ERO13_D10G078600v2 [Gossypium hirsutum]|uniref:Transmembrane protein n=1 Tax=Gossypium hirsutum TaxID=3635 RepID=A0A1U8KJS2_GOSHI|nr:uncharacterized protein LOC107916275 [Gossypium hirsutum]KAG4125125.1 hypothetical protein ERO13_D10G078600v2 [Gossypium hirsutum]